MTSIREDVINIAADVLGVPPDKVTDETRLDGDQCNILGLRYVMKSGKMLIIGNLQDSTVGDIISEAEKG